MLDLASVRSSQTRILHSARAGRADGRPTRLARNRYPRGGSVELAVDRSRQPPRPPAPRSASTTRRPPCSPRSKPSPAPTESPTTPPSSRRWCAPRSALGNPELAERLVAGVEPRTPAAEHALATVERRPRRGPRRTRCRRPGLRRRRRPLAVVRRCSRAGLRPPRTGPLPHPPRSGCRSHRSPPAGSRHLPDSAGGPRPRRNRSAAATSRRAERVGSPGATATETSRDPAPPNCRKPASIQTGRDRPR